MNALFRLVALPYAAVAIAWLGTLRLVASGGARASAASPGAPEGERPSWGTLAFHLGLLVVLGGHVAGAIAPGWYTRWSADPRRLLAAEVVGLAAALVALVGLLVVAWRRASVARMRAVTTRADVAVFLLVLLQIGTGVAVACAHRWGSVWYAQVVVPYLRSMAVLAPELGSVGGLPVSFQLHVAAGFVIGAAVPFTRLAHVLAAASGTARLLGRIVRERAPVAARRVAPPGAQP